MLAVFVGIIAGFIGATLLVSVLIRGAIEAKRRNSHPHDVCRHCGYHVGDLDRCPECGLKSPTRT